MVRLPLIEDLTTGPVPRGSNLLVEYDPTSQWYNASLTIAAGWLKAGGTVLYGAAAQPLEKIRAQLERLGVDAEELERKDKLQLWDWYTCQLGHKSKERYGQDSLKVSDLSIRVSKFLKVSPPVREEGLRILDDASCLARYNDEKAWVEFTITRSIPMISFAKSTAIRGVIRGVHSKWVYKQLEAAHDGVIDFKLREKGDEPQNFMRIRAMRNVPFDAKWHLLKIARNFELSLKKLSSQKATLERTRKKSTFGTSVRKRRRRLRVYISMARR